MFKTQRVKFNNTNSLTRLTSANQNQRLKTELTHKIDWIYFELQCEKTKPEALTLK